MHLIYMFNHSLSPAGTFDIALDKYPTYIRHNKYLFGKLPNPKFKLENRYNTKEKSQKLKKKKKTEKIIKNNMYILHQRLFWYNPKFPALQCYI